MFGDIGVAEIIIIFLVILLFFGARRLPELAKGLGRGVREFKKGLKDVGNESVEESRSSGDRDLKFKKNERNSQ